MLARPPKPARNSRRCCSQRTWKVWLASKGNGNIITPARPLPELRGGQPVLHRAFAMRSSTEDGTTCSSRQTVCLATSEPTFGAFMTESARSCQYILHLLDNNPVTVAGGTRLTFSTYSINLQCSLSAQQRPVSHPGVIARCRNSSVPLRTREGPAFLAHLHLSQVCSTICSVCLSNSFLHNTVQPMLIVPAWYSHHIMPQGVETSPTNTFIRRFFAT